MEQQPKSTKVLKIMMAVVCIVSIAGILCAIKNAADKQAEEKAMAVPYSDTIINSTNTDSTPTITPRNTQSYTLSAGNYTVGTDIQAGTYDIFWQSGDGLVHAGDLVEIFGTSSVGITQFKNAQLTDGMTVEISDTVVVKFDPK